MANVESAITMDDCPCYFRIELTIREMMLLQFHKKIRVKQGNRRFEIRIVQGDVK